MEAIIRLRFKIFLVVLLLAGLFYAGKAEGQILKDTVTLNLIKTGISNIYNLRLDEARSVLAKLNSKYPGHPANSLFDGIIRYYANYPMVPSNPESKGFERLLKSAIDLCESEEGWQNDPEKLLIDLCSRGLLLMYYAENDLTGDVIGMVMGTYKGVMKSFQFTSVYPDFSYFTGLYNYYREAYPDYRPVYKPIALLLAPGDREKGMKELRYSAENAVVLKAESYSILSWINIYIEKNFSLAVNYSRALSSLYPANLLFRSEYIKVLLLLKRYDEAERIILTSGEEKNMFFQGQMAIYSGLIQEKKYGNITAAERYFRKGITDLQKFRARGREYVKYGEKGLGRLEDIRNGREERKKRNNGPEEVDSDILKF